uniref:hypothetical protein n=1 Tax=Escherichia coli TaxID=562 RepID=UPI0015C3542A
METPQPDKTGMHILLKLASLVVILMPEPVAEPALNGLRLNLRIVSIVMFNFA